ncbi:hypothetical protein EOPP23_13450 [Endozoicomonas sp. OPT23]|uniref:glutathione S-transferase family protein n=1 Tax=Endozoicomonas sp. OPT23 TaxID=2072845 RepID=UPI00129B737C|nr:glutathione S-transferase family protein [Endozoicomonas sp. OPT23]MRI33996.1 hypothetical protein [Endozoicomonas sp. OPT23]
MITIHLYALSPFNEKIVRTLHYKGINNYRMIEYPLGDRRVKKISPTGKLPCIEFNGQFIQDSTDIVYFLEREFPEHSVLPAKPEQQALVHILEDWADESLYFYEMHMRFGLPHNGKKNIPRMLVNSTGFMHWFLSKVLPSGILKITESQGIGRKHIEQLIIDVRRHLDAVDKLLQNNQWLVANQFSLADMAVCAMFDCLKDAEEVAEMLSAYPKITDWMKRVQALTDQPVIRIEDRKVSQLVDAEARPA